MFIKNLHFHAFIIPAFFSQLLFMSLVKLSQPHKSNRFFFWKKRNCKTTIWRVGLANILGQQIVRMIHPALADCPNFIPDFTPTDLIASEVAAPDNSLSTGKSFCTWHVNSCRLQLQGILTHPRFTSSLLSPFTRLDKKENFETVESPDRLIAKLGSRF